MPSWLIDELMIGVKFFTTGGISFPIVAPVASWSLLSSAFQLILGVSLSVLTPNFTDSPGLIDSEAVKIMIPAGVFYPEHTSSVLKEVKIK